ncbi:O-methyltransferase [Pseudovirgaria hyperparasitica]|uniref:O-methyltransferase n=1 Tax=Pseudovirgaria hyperparasitica TaxID=470096 RepID=A0A6A6W279_9PEZI|nr:O-methyltransferase [Pseudovirgaria hyperparasitica]KAF2756219.1 O-methyltransferase [Pseudovirgaria hyperparasitica]
MAHEKDPRWTAVDEYVNANLLADAKLNGALEEALKRTRAQRLPDIAVSAAQGKFLQLQCKLIGARNVLEVGTLGGYSSIFLAATSPEIRVVTVEVNEHHAAVARENIAAAGYADRVEVIVGAGRDVLPELLANVNAGKREKFDFVFIDADKPNNWFYFDTAVKMCRPRAQIIVDNVIRGGRLANPEAFEDPSVAGSREVIEKVGRDPRVDAVALQTVGEKSYDGMLITVVKDT